MVAFHVAPGCLGQSHAIEPPGAQVQDGVDVLLRPVGQDHLVAHPGFETFQPDGGDQRGQAGGAVLEGTEVQILADVVAQLYACLTECRFVGPLGLAAYAELSSMAASLMLGEWFD